MIFEELEHQFNYDNIEEADIEREKLELAEMPEIELQRLADIYESRGLKKETALIVAKELTEHDALGAHVRDELGINEISKANPIQAALASGASFVFGGALPLVVVFLFPLKSIELYIYISSTIFLIILGAFAAQTGGAKIMNSILRITFWGTITMGITALLGYLFGVNL